MDKEANAVRKEQWRRIVNDCINRDPQISKRRWCEENGIKFRSFIYWQHKFRNEALEQMDALQAAVPAVTASALAPAFVDVTAKYEDLQSVQEETSQRQGNFPASTELMIQVGDLQIYVNGSVQMSTLEKVMKVMSRLMSYVPQAIHLTTDFSVIDYISLGRTPHIGMVNKLTEKDYQIIESVSSLLGVDEIYDVSFNKLSGGQKQMVAVARSLVQETPIIIMDEPMSALDIGKQVELLQVLRSLAETGKTIILTTHNPNHALVLESNSCFLKRGEIIAYGESSDIIRDDLLHEIYGRYVALDQGEKGAAIMFDLG